MQKVSARKLRRLASVGVAIEGELQQIPESRNKDYGKNMHHNQPQPSQPKDTATMSTQTQTEEVKSNKHNDTARAHAQDYNVTPEGLKGEELFAYHVARISSETHQLHTAMLEDNKPVKQIQKSAITFGLAFTAVVAAELFMGWLFSSKVAPMPTDVAPIPGVKK
jgi:hypothetical protein